METAKYLSQWAISIYRNNTFKSLVFLVKPVQHNSMFKPLPDDKILDRSKLKQIADDILKCT